MPSPDASGAPFAAFTPARLLGNRHAQTIWGGLLRRRPRLPRTIERWALPDGETVRVALTEERPGRPGVVVLHGLEGSADARYVMGLLARIAAAGWNGAAFDFRSCEPRGRATQPGPPSRVMYHAGKTDDLAAIVARLAARWPGVPIAGAGFSLGGNVLLKWLGETGSGSPLDAAVAISVPFDLGACADAIDGRGVMRFVYRERFLRSLRRKALGALAAYPDLGSPPLATAAIRACRTFAAYDGTVVASLFGFSSARDYWQRSSARGHLHGIRRPTLLISAADDPFVPASSVPSAEIAANPALTLHLVAGGGHVGFVAGSPLRPRYHAEDATIAYLEARFSGVERR